MAAKQEPLKKDDHLVPAGNTTLPMAATEQAQIALIFAPTPQEFIKRREGRGGKTFDYVETNYVIARLNATFLCDWDLDIIEEKIFKEISQIATKVKLTVRFLGGRTTSKTAWGGSSIKTNSNNDIIDIADDLKSAESDALKKAASMVGICWDVYSGMTNGKQVDTPKFEPEPKPIKQETDDEGFDEDITEMGDVESEGDAKEKGVIASWLKLYLEKKTIDYKDFKKFLDETQWKPARTFVGKQFGNLSLNEGKVEDLRYLKKNIDKCVDKYLTKQMAK